MNDQERAEALEHGLAVARWHLKNPNDSDGDHDLLATVLLATHEELEHALALNAARRDQRQLLQEDQERLEAEVAQLKAELQKMVPYEDFAALEATSDGSDATPDVPTMPEMVEENRRTLSRWEAP